MTNELTPKKMRDWAQEMDCYTFDKLDIAPFANAWERDLQWLNEVRKDRDRLRVALQPFADEYVADDAACHVGLVSKEECCRCGPILRAREALAATEEQSE